MLGGISCLDLMIGCIPLMYPWCRAACMRAWFRKIPSFLRKYPLQPALWLGSYFCQTPNSFSIKPERYCLHCAAIWPQVVVMVYCSRVLVCVQCPPRSPQMDLVRAILLWDRAYLRLMYHCLDQQCQAWAPSLHDSWGQPPLSDFSNSYTTTVLACTARCTSRHRNQTRRRPSIRRSLRSCDPVT